VKIGVFAQKRQSGDAAARNAHHLRFVNLANVVETETLR
jgi:hypothetical protein